MYKARINVTLRSSILDPHGKATHTALVQLGFDAVNDVRIGKHIEMNIAAESEAAAVDIARQACQRLLANPVMEDFSVAIQNGDD